MMTIAESVEQIQKKIEQAAAGRRVRIVAATKTVPPVRIQEAYGAGIRIFGENRIQEAIKKIEICDVPKAEWHFIGHLQSNKVRDAIRYFSWIQSIDSLKLLEKVENEAVRQNKKMTLLLELNIGEEATKHGLYLSELDKVLQRAEQLRLCTVRGFMIIPPYFDDPEQTRPFFRRLREIRDTCAPHLPELSMGMSHDYEIAVQEGATMVRIGTALFGERSEP